MKTLDSQRRLSIFSLISRSLDNSLKRLEKICGKPWELSNLTAHVPPFGQLLDSSDKRQHYGVYLSMPGGAFLSLFTRENGMELAEMFLGEQGQSLKRMETWPSAALSELAGIASNGICDVLADTCDLGFILSPPEINLGNQHEHLEAALKRFNGFGGFGKHWIVRAQMQNLFFPNPLQYTLLIFLSFHLVCLFPKDG